jgi:hypothetical protein
MLGELMNGQLKLTGRDWMAVLLVAVCQAAVAWLMALLGLVYAPVPMFAAAILAGIIFKGRPQTASLAGALAGLGGGILAERAYHYVRMAKVIMNWSELSSPEQFGLSLAEMLLYTSLLSFFAAFISWGTHREAKMELEKPVSKRTPYGSQDLKVDLPLFKAEDEEDQPAKSSAPSKDKRT